MPCNVICSAAVLSLLALTSRPAYSQVSAESATPMTITVGITLYDRGNFEAAAEIFRRFLADNPGHPLATYELALTYAALKVYDDCIAISQEGRALESVYTNSFFVLEANCTDEAGRPEDALRLYQHALAIDPSDPDLHFNFAVTLYRQDDLDEAMMHLKLGLEERPLHQSSHYLLAGLYYRLGYPVPSILAYMRFLALEFNTKRSRTAIARLVQQAQRNVRRSDEDGTIYLIHNIGQKTDEGDFISVSLAMDSLLGVFMTGKVPYESKSHLMFMVLQGGIGALDDAAANNSSFVYDIYVPIFVSMKADGYFEPFSHMIMNIGGVEGASQWLTANPERTQGMYEWIKSYNAKVTVK